MIKIDQIAIAVPNLEYVLSQLKEIGLGDWKEDQVVTDGQVYDSLAENTEASLRFNYDLIDGKEFEMLRYEKGRNWHKSRVDNDNCTPFLSHLGMHVKDRAEFDAVITKMLSMGYKIAQEVITKSHTNEAIKDNRRYRYAIFNSHRRLGFDLKIILRLSFEK